MPSTVKFWLDRVFAAVLMTMLMTAGGARAGGELFDGCLDARGQPIAAIVDDTLPQVALAAQSGGRIELRHNPARLPELSHRVRMFYFAHECARIALGHPLAERSAERARQADCWALATLERSGEMAAPDARRELETALMVEDAQWAAIPGPRRVIDLAACSVKGGCGCPAVRRRAKRRCAWIGAFKAAGIVFGSARIAATARPAAGVALRLTVFAKRLAAPRRNMTSAMSGWKWP